MNKTPSFSQLREQLLESITPSFSDGVDALFSTLFEANTASSRDAVDMLQSKVGENVNKADDGENIVGLAAQAGMGDQPLPDEEDEMINAVNADVAQTVDVPKLPTEDDIPDLPTPEPQPIETSENLDSLDDMQADISETPPPEDIDLPLDFSEENPI